MVMTLSSLKETVSHSCSGGCKGVQLTFYFTGNGRSRVEPLKESKLRKPELHEIPSVATAFHEQLKKVFGTS